MIEAWKKTVEAMDHGDTELEQQKRMLLPPQNIIYLVKRNPSNEDGTEFFVCSDQCDVDKISIDYANIKIDDKYVGHSSSVRSVELSKDGKKLITGCADHSLRIWDTETQTS